MAVITIWHNPRCSKSRQALTLLQDNNVSVTIRKYLEDNPSSNELRALHRALGLPPVLNMVRRTEPEFKQAGLHAKSDDDALFAAMVACPKLIERPVVIRGDRAVIGRPPEAVLGLL